MLRLEHVSVAYGKHEALHDVTLDAEAGQTTVILGANGAGKTTMLKTIAGLVRPRPGGRILFEGRPIEHSPPHAIVAAGISLVPEGRSLFGDMTIIENLRLGAYTEHARANAAAQLERQLELFPRLAERTNQLAKTMSGGEQQMLAIARALMAEPKLLLLDEPSLGLGPRLVKDLFAVLRKITDAGQSVVLVEQNVHQSLRLADRVYVLENGQIVRSGTPAALQQDQVIQQAYLGLESQRPMAEREEATNAFGGFVNPLARSVSPPPARVEKEPARATNSHAGGFYNPAARSVERSEEPEVRKPEETPGKGGFFNPFARP